MGLRLSEEVLNESEQIFKTGSEEDIKTFLQSLPVSTPKEVGDVHYRFRHYCYPYRETDGSNSIPNIDVIIEHAPVDLLHEDVDCELLLFYAMRTYNVSLVKAAIENNSTKVNTQGVSAFKVLQNLKESPTEQREAFKEYIVIMETLLSA